MANNPPAGRWMRMATLRPMSNPAQDPPSPRPPAPRPVLGRTFTSVPFRPAIQTTPAPGAALPPALGTAPPRQVTPIVPDVPAIGPASMRLAAGTNGIPPPQGAPNTTSVSNGVPSTQQAYTAPATNGAPPQRAPMEVTTNGAPSPQRAPNAIITSGGPSLQSPAQAPAALTPSVKPSPQPAPVNAVPSPQKSQAAPDASPVRQTSPTIAYGAQQLLSPRVNSQPPPPISTNTTSPISKAQYTPQVYKPKSPSQQSPQTPSVGYRSPAASPSPQKQAASPPNFISTTSAPAPRMVTFSNVQSLSSPTKSQVSPAASTTQIPTPNTTNPPDRTPPRSPKTMDIAPPPSPLHLPPPQLHSDTKLDPKIPQEPEQKSILFQQTSEKHKPSTINSPNHKSPEITKQENNTKPTTKHTHPQHGKHPDSDVFSRSIITIAGENRGALMNLSRPHTTNLHPHPHPQFPGNPHKLTSPSNSKINGTESDQSSGSNGSKPKSKDAVSAARKSFTNSNVQGINNSIMFNSTVTHHDPGVHVAHSRKHEGRGPHGHGRVIRHYKDRTDGDGHQS